MFEQIKQKLSEEETQRNMLRGVKIVGVFIASQIFAHYVNSAGDLGIDKLMERLHPKVETPAAE